MREATPDDSTKDLRESAPFLREWALVLAPAVVWAVEFQTTYTLVWVLCTRGGWVPILVVLLVAASLTVASGLVAHVGFRRLGGAWPGPGVGAPDRARFMAILAVLASAIFTLVIVLQGVATLVFRPCD